MSRKTLVLDSSQVSAYEMCPEFHNLQYRENLTLSEEVREDFAMGTFGHKLLELYFANKGKMGWQPAYEKALAFDPDVVTCECSHDVQEHDTNACTKCSCLDFKAQMFPLSAAKREIVRERFYTFALWDLKNPLTPVLNKAGDKLLVEQGFSYPLLDNEEYLFVLEGRIDLICLRGSDEHLMWVDHKWQGREHTLYKKSIQFRNYNLATGLNHGMINYMRLHKNVLPNTIVQEPIYFSALETEMWRLELIEIFKKIANEMDNPIRRRNRDACSGKFGYKCLYTDICEENHPDTRQAVKETKFKIKKEWKPW